MGSAVQPCLDAANAECAWLGLVLHGRSDMADVVLHAVLFHKQCSHFILSSLSYIFCALPA